MIRHALAILLFVALFTLYGASSTSVYCAIAGDGSDNSASLAGSGTSNTPSDPLSVSAINDPMNRVGQPVFVTITITNRSEANLLLENIDMKIDGASKDLFTQNSTVCGLERRGEIALSRGQSFQQTCRFEMKSISAAWSSESLRERLLAVDVRLSIIAEIDTLGTYSYYPSITVRAANISIFIGGVCGALLLATFVGIQNMLTSTETLGKVFRDLGVAILMGVRGGIMAVIALLLSTTTSSVGAPVSLQVSDFAGGIIVGLFSYPLAAWISSVLKAGDQ